MPQPDPAALLGQVAEALTACEKASIPVKLKHGIVSTRNGYVLPVGDGWVARTLAYSPFSPPETVDGMDD